MNRINIYIDNESLAQLDKQAKKEGRTRSAQIREMVKEQAVKQMSELDKEAWDALMSLKDKKLSPERKAAILMMRDRITYNKDGSITAQLSK